MFLSEAALRRPVAMSCLIIALALLGINAYRTMGLELLPKVDVPYITIVTVYPGASPEEIETDIAKRIEDEVVSIEGLKHVSSSCMENVCQILLEFHLDVDVDIAATDVREKLDLIRSDFPEDVEDPKVVKFDVNAKPIITLALTGDAALDELYDFADNTLRDRITVLPGVADAELVGGAEREVHVLLDREALAARGLSSMDVVAAIQQGVRTIPSGRVRESGTEYAVKFDADYDTIEDLGRLEVANDDGRRCYVEDVGRPIMTTEELRQRAFIDGRSCVAIKVVKKSDANAVRVVHLVRDAMDELNENLPGGMELIWVTDDGRFTEATVSSAWTNVGQGILLTALILFLFLYNVRSTLVVAVTMPLTIIIGLFFMQILGFTLNTSTLLSIGMSVGILVTNSIVVLEAIVKHLERTGDPKKAAHLGAREAGIAVLASAGTNVVVLFPLSVMGGIVGLFIRPFALTMVTMTVVSLFISFTLTPILCSILLIPKRQDSRSPLAYMERAWNWMFQRVLGAYGGILRLTERHRTVAALVLLLVAALFVHSLSLAEKVGFSFMSESDRAEVYAKLEFPTRYDLAQTVERVQEVERILSGLPELRKTLSTIGKVEGMIGQSSEGVYLAQILLRFSDKDQRTLSIDELMADVRARLSGLPDCIVTVGMPSTIGGQSSDIELEIAGDDLDELDRLATDVRGFSDGISGILDPDTTVRIGKPELRVRPDRPVLADLGIPATGMGLALRANLEGITAGTFKQGARNYDIVVEFQEDEGKDQVQEFLFPGAPGHPLTLASLGEVEESIAPVQITRKDKRRVSKLFANLDSRKPMGTAVDELSAAIDERADLPAGYAYNFAGDYEYMTESQSELGEASLIAVILVILTLAAILESFKQPVIILVTLPLGLVGTLWALALTGNSITIFVIMGGVMLIGIVVNNAILVMDQFNVHVAEGVPRHKAMVSASCERFRPIVMITLAAVLGMMPLAVSRGIGAEMRNGVGIASVGGILVCGILTVIVLPVLYDFFTRRAKAHPADDTASVDAPTAD
ncbi:MAG: efflux RND transporter permease subunit [Candidatus Hydrogenedentes bacterium]|nr:efflux RND transporter permease subunit [Candidatus Hydrogenedentota bacterium]